MSKIMRQLEAEGRAARQKKEIKVTSVDLPVGLPAPSPELEYDRRQRARWETCEHGYLDTFYCPVCNPQYVVPGSTP